MAIRTRSYSDGWGEWSAWVQNTTAGAQRAAIIASTYTIGCTSNSTQYPGNFPLCAIIQFRQRATLAEYQTDMETQCNRLPGVTA